MYCGTNNTLRNIFHTQFEMWEIFYKILSVPHNIVMNLNNVMDYYKVFRENSSIVISMRIFHFYFESSGIVVLWNTHVTSLFLMSTPN